MISTLISILGTLLVGLLLFLVLKKKNLLRVVKWRLALAGICILLLVVLSIIPWEHYFITFSSPDKAFQYRNSEKIVAVVDGKNSTMVVGQKSNGHVLDFFVKDSSGWKLGKTFDVKTEASILTEEGVSVMVVRYKETSDFYIIISENNNGELEITDNRGGSFYSVCSQAYGSQKSYTYFGYVENLDGTYSLTINGRICSLRESFS